MKKLFLLIFGLALFLLPALSWADWSAWTFDWSTRTDGDSQPAGHYSGNTPFPVDENSSTYVVYNDENLVSGTTFTLGTIYFVDDDGTDCSNGDTDYDPATESCGAGSETVYTSLANAWTGVAAGNKTILVRDGTYTITATLTPKSGTDSTHPFSVIGYKHERPILDGTGYSNCFSDNGVDYFTLQRLKIQNFKGRAVRSSQSSYYRIFDVYFYTNCTECYNGGANNEDGQVHFLGAVGSPLTYPWFYHNTSERSYMKAFKVSDNSDNIMFEWNVAKEAGYWTGIPNTPVGHPYLFDFAADSDAGSNDNLTMRYNIGYTGLWGAECRWAENYDIHHNELYDPCHADDFADEDSNWGGQGGWYMSSASAYGEFHNNIIRDNDDTQYPHLLTASSYDSGNVNYFYNNLLYGTTNDAIFLEVLGDREFTAYFYNNTIYGSTTTALVDGVDADLGADDNVRFKNNIVHQASTGPCIDLDSDVTWDYNLYYYPSGSLGETAGANDFDSGTSTDPDWVVEPAWGTWSSTEGTVNGASDALSTGTSELDGIFTDDFWGTSRGVTWSIGAYDLTGVIITATDAAAAEEGQATGTFRVTRPGSSGNLVVSFTLGGTVDEVTDVDEDLSGGTVTILDGNTYVDQTITPTDDATVEGQENLTMTIAADGYTIGSPSQAEIIIVDNESVEGQIGLIVLGSGTGAITRDSAGTGLLVR